VLPVLTYFLIYLTDKSPSIWSLSSFRSTFHNVCLGNAVITLPNDAAEYLGIFRHCSRHIHLSRISVTRTLKAFFAAQTLKSSNSSIPSFLTSSNASEIVNVTSKQVGRVAQTV
jgi:hypothetical protein